MPKGWNEVTIRQMMEAEQIESDTEMNEIEKMAMMVSLFSGISLIEINKITLKQVKEAYSQLLFMKVMPSNKFVNDFEIDGKKYFVNPDITKLTASQFMAFDHYTKDGKSKENIHNLMSIICLEEGEVYDMTKSAYKSEIFYNKMTIDIVHPVSDFFLNLLTKSLENIQHSLDLELNKTMMEIREEMIQSQD